MLGAWSVRCVGWADWVDCRCFLSFVFLSDARRLELSPCNTPSMISWLPVCYTRKATPARHRPERQHNTRSNRRKQRSANETKPYSNPTPPRKRQTTPTNGHTPRRMKPTHTRLTAAYHGCQCVITHVKQSAFGAQAVRLSHEPLLHAHLVNRMRAVHVGGGSIVAAWLWHGSLA